MPVRPATPPPAVSPATRFEAALVSRIGAERYGMWFRGHTAAVVAGGELRLVVSNETFQGWLDQTFGKALRAAAEEVGAALRFVVDPDLLATADPKPVEEPPPAPAKKPTAGKKPLPGDDVPKPTRTLFGDEPAPPPSPRARKFRGETGEPPPVTPSSGRRWKSLADFVVGVSNRVAHASALSVVEEPADCANPLVLHGPVGTGKTHLLEGICAGIRKTHPDARPVFITAEEFTTRYVQACRFDKQAQFRRQFRDCSVLLLDDLHFLATKPGSQKEFIQTLDAVVAAGGQVVVTTDCHPRLADDLMPELVDRLLGGAVWPLQPPDDATRLDILRAKVGRGAAIPEGVLKYLARNLKGNVRELEGAINSVRHFAKVTARPVDQALAKEALGDLLRHTVRTITVQDVDEAVCRVLGLNKGTLQSKARNWAVSHPRMLAMYLARKHTSATYGEIAKHFGVKTHSTAVAAEKKVRAWLQKGETLALADRKWDVKDLLDKVVREAQR